MNAWKLIAATLVIFGAGVGTGGLLVVFSDRAMRPVEKPVIAGSQSSSVEAPIATPVRETRPGPPTSPLFRKDLIDRLNRELQLTPDQRERIDHLIQEGQDRTRELWHVEWVATRQQIHKVLRPDQQARFEELLKPRGRRELAATNTVERVFSNSVPAVP